MDLSRLRKLERRLYSRIPLIGGWLRRRAAEALARDDSPKAVRALAEAVARSEDERVRDIALERIRCIDTQPRINAVCAVWAATRHPDLTALLTEHGWVASAPADVKVFSALKTKRLELVTKGGASVVEPLVQACKDADPTIAERARLALGQLKKEEAQEALCHLLVERDHPIAREAAIAAGYVPRNEYQRALFFFLTEQWDRYEALDFDQRLLRTVYDSADAALRQRVMEKLRTAGRTDFLIVVAGGDYRSRAAVMTPREADLLVQMLAANREWAKLWALAFELSFNWSVRIVKILVQSGWRPETGDEQATFEKMASLASAEAVVSEQEASRLLPPAIWRAQARVPGRINDIAFSPARPVIAIGTGRQKVGLWNFQQGTMETVLDGFDHSVGQVVFAPDGTLLCAERTNSYSACSVHSWRDGQRFRLGQHGASVTAVEPAGDSQALTAGRDGKVIVWDIGVAERKVGEQSFGFWARAARVSPDRQQAILLHRGATLVSVPQLSVLAGTSGNVSRCAAFAPNGESLIVGEFSGEVIVYERKGRRLQPEKRLFTRHHSQAQSVEVLPNRPVVITAGSDGLVQFTSWTDRAPIGSVRTPGERLTSLKISPDGAFMAVGDSDASMSLWDLRLMDLFTRPLAQALPTHLTIIGALTEDANLEPQTRQALKFVECVLRHRFQYAIEIGEAPTIKVGEFDIEIE